MCSVQEEVRKMYQQTPEAHWSFKVPWNEIDVPRIIREAEGAGAAYFRVATEFRPGPGCLLFVKADSNEFQAIARKWSHSLCPVGANARLAAEGLICDKCDDESAAAPAWFVILCNTPEQEAIISMEVAQARSWARKKHRVTVTVL